jgi:hypothetical protein
LQVKFRKKTIININVKDNIMLTLNICKKHKNGVYETRLSKSIIQAITNDVEINLVNTIKIEFLYLDTSGEFNYKQIDFSVLIDRETFENEDLQNFYNPSNEEEINNFTEKYMGKLCMQCLKEYENRHNLLLTKDLKFAAFF